MAASYGWGDAKIVSDTGGSCFFISFLHFFLLKSVWVLFFRL
jgi:hypothetical protein